MSNFSDILKMKSEYPAICEYSSSLHGFYMTDTRIIHLNATYPNPTRPSSAGAIPSINPGRNKKADTTR